MRLKTTVLLILTFCATAAPGQGQEKTPAKAPAVELKAPAAAVQSDPLGSAKSQELLVKGLQISAKVREKAYQEAAALAKGVLDSKEGGPWIRAYVHLFLASAAFQQKQEGQGLKELEAAIKAGFASPFDFHSEVPAGFYSKDAVKALYSQMRLSSDDWAELTWHRAEQSAIDHDSSMMIIANTGRKDSAYTQVPQSQIPRRSTRSATVIAMRELTRYLQARQKLNVLKSDQSRINHITSMGIIGNMGKKSAMQRSFEQQAILRSQQMALSAYKARLEAIKKRAFKAPGLETPARIPALGQISTKAPEKKASPSQGKSQAKSKPENGLARVKVGDQWTYDQFVISQGKLVGQSLNVETITAVKGGKIKSQLKSTNLANGQSQTESIEIELEKTIKAQIVASFARAGKVEVLQYKTEFSSFPYQGLERLTTKVTMSFHWTVNNQKQQCLTVWQLSKDVPGLGALGISIQFPNGVEIRQILKSVKRKP